MKKIFTLCFLATTAMLTPSANAMIMCFSGPEAIEPDQEVSASNSDWTVKDSDTGTVWRGVAFYGELKDDNLDVRGVKTSDQGNGNVGCYCRLAYPYLSKWTAPNGNTTNCATECAQTAIENPGNFEPESFYGGLHCPTDNQTFSAINDESIKIVAGDCPSGYYSLGTIPACPTPEETATGDVIYKFPCGMYKWEDGNDTGTFADPEPCPWVI